MHAWLFAVVEVELLLKMDNARAAVDREDVGVHSAVTVAIFVSEKAICDWSLIATVDRLEAVRLDVDDALMKARW